jgi:hypothetical protein
MLCFFRRYLLGRGLDERVERLASSGGLPSVAVEASMVLLVVT